jgi:Fe2+ or Zn2+ uptake regulation protein
MIEEILKAMAPSPARPAEIRKALQDNGVSISFTAIRNALRQLEARNAAEQAGDSRTWRYRGGAA